MDRYFVWSDSADDLMWEGGTLREIRREKKLVAQVLTLLNSKKK